MGFTLTLNTDSVHIWSCAWQHRLPFAMWSASLLWHPYLGRHQTSVSTLNPTQFKSHPLHLMSQPYTSCLNLTSGHITGWLIGLKKEWPKKYILFWARQLYTAVSLRQDSAHMLRPFWHWREQHFQEVLERYRFSRETILLCKLVKNLQAN